jgi:hypothetical protein
MSLLGTLAGAAVLALLGLCAMLWLGQSRMVFFPAATLDADPGAVGLAYQDVRLQTADGLLLHG